MAATKCPGPALPSVRSCDALGAGGRKNCGLAPALFMLLGSCSVPPAIVSGAAESRRLPSPIPVATLDDVPASQIVRDRGVSYYVLAISWSPQWCDARGDRLEDVLQCRDNRFGWVLHGLWPNAQEAPHPRYCREQSLLTVSTVRRNLCLTPSVQLLQHEWAAHGTCGWANADDYFDQAARLWRNLGKPDASHFPAEGSPLPAGRIRAAFAAQNAGLSHDAIQIAVDKGGSLTEVRICYDLAMRYRTCPPNNGWVSDGQTIAVRPIARLPAAPAANGN